MVLYTPFMALQRCPYRPHMSGLPLSLYTTLPEGCMFHYVVHHMAVCEKDTSSTSDQTTTYDRILHFSL